MDAHGRACVVCGRRSASESGWFLLVEHGWGDRLKILPWDNCVALQAGIHCACTASHVERLVAHWMVKGKLGYFLEPYKSEFPETRKDVAGRRCSAIAPDGDVIKGLQAGEIAIDRGALNRALRENPFALDEMLRALISVLERRRTNESRSSEECLQSELVV